MKAIFTKVLMCLLVTLGTVAVAQCTDDVRAKMQASGKFSEQEILDTCDPLAQQSLMSNFHVQEIGIPLIVETGGLVGGFFSSDGTIFITGQELEKGSVVIFWDISNPRAITAIREVPLDASIYSMAISPKRDLIALGSVAPVISSGASTIALLNVENQQVLSKSLRMPGTDSVDIVRALSFSPDGHLLASSNDKKVILWNLNTYQALGNPLQGHSDDVATLTFSPDGQLLASGSRDDTIVLWDVNDHQALGAPLRRHGDNIVALAFSPNGVMLVSGGVQSNGASLAIWNMETRQNVVSSDAFPVISLGFSFDGRFLAAGAGAWHEYVKLWDLGSDSEVLELPTSEGIMFVDFSPEGYLLSGASRKSVTFWEIDIVQ